MSVTATWKIYAYLSASWVDISEDVLTRLPMSFGWGIRGNETNDRLAGTGNLSFTLDNSSGKYSPDGVSALSGWKKGVPIKLVFTYAGSDYVRFRGAIDTIKIEPGITTTRRVGIGALDWLDYAAKYPLDLPAVELNKTADYTIGAMVAAMPIQPQTTSYDAGLSTFPTIFDSATAKTKAYAEFSKLALSEPGYMYLQKDKANGEKLVFESATHRNGLVPLSQITLQAASSGYLLKEDGGFLLLETGDKILLDLAPTVSSVHVNNEFLNMNVEYGTKIVNRFNVNVYPKRIDTSPKKIYSLENPIPFSAGQTQSFRIQYTDPSSKRLTAALPPTNDGTKSLLHFEVIDNPVSDSPIEDATGRIWEDPNIKAVLQSTVKKFGATAMYLDGSNSYIRTENSGDFDFGSGNFTVEWWEYRYDLTSGQTTFRREETSSYPPFAIGRSDGANRLVDMSSNGTSNDIANGKSMGSISTSTWVHLAICRSGNNFYTFKNGTQIDTWTSSASLKAGSDWVSIGRNGGTYLNAVIDEFRVIKGAAKYTASFTPPTAAFELSGVFFLATTTKTGGYNITGDFTVTPTYGGNGADFVITNGSTSNGYLRVLDVYSYAVQSDAPISDIQEDSPSINEYGYQNEDLQQSYQQDAYAGHLEALKVLEAEKQPRTVVNSVTMSANRNDAMMAAFLSLDVGDFVHLTETQTGVDGYYWIQGVNANVNGGLAINYTWTVKEMLVLGKGLSLMAVEFDNASTDAVIYGYIPKVSYEKTPNRFFSAWVYLDAYATTTNRTVFSMGDTSIYITTDKLVFKKGFSTTTGVWSTNASPFLVGGWVHIGIVYNATGTTAAPVIYVNGSAVTTNETTTPAGTLTGETGADIVLGNTILGTTPFDGKIKDVRVYSVTASAYTAAQLAANIYAEGAAGTGYTSGMIFQAFAVRTADVTGYTDMVLTADDKLLESYLGFVGTPSGTPTARSI